MWKEATVGLFKVLAKNLTEGTEETMKNLSQYRSELSIPNIMHCFSNQEDNTI
jgi:hypothetical protein